jgi:hypothetical protein
VGSRPIVLAVLGRKTPNAVGLLPFSEKALVQNTCSAAYVLTAYVLGSVRAQYIAISLKVKALWRSRVGVGDVAFCVNLNYTQM